MNSELYEILEDLDPAKSAIRLWGGLADSVEHIRTGESGVYRFTDYDGDKVFLRLIHPDPERFEFNALLPAPTQSRFISQISQLQCDSIS